MAVVGNEVGTHRAFFSCRAASQSCGDASSCLAAGGAESLKLAARKVAELHVQGFRIVAVKRDQDSLGRFDAFRLHGFLIFRMEYPDGESTRFLRLDWGEGGLCWQEAREESLLMSYMEALEEAERARAEAGTSGRGNSIVAGGLFGTGAASTAWWSTATTVAGASSSALIAVSALGIGLYTIHIDAEEAHGAAQFQEVPHPSSALPRLHRILKELEVAGGMYSVSRWNCNHLANHVVDTMLNPLSAYEPRRQTPTLPAVAVEFFVNVTELDERTVAEKALAACLRASRGQPFELVCKSEAISDRLGREIDLAADDPGAVRQQVLRFPLTFRMEILPLRSKGRWLGGCFQTCFLGLRHGGMSSGASAAWLRGLRTELGREP